MRRSSSSICSLKKNSKKRSENSEYRPLCLGPAHWIPAFAGMTAYCPKAGFQTASKKRVAPKSLRP